MIDTYRDTKQAFYNAGITPPEYIEVDGRFHRYAQPDKPRSKSSWYILHNTDRGIAGYAGDFRLNLRQNIVTWRDSAPSAAECKQTKSLLAKSRALAEKVRQTEMEAISRRAQQIWNTAQLANRSHPYLIRKEIDPFNLRCTSGHLVVPLVDTEGKLWSIQTIDASGRKRFLAGGRTKGLFTTVQRATTDVIYITEGIATCHSVAMYTDVTTVCAFNANNLPIVAKAISDKYPTRRLIIAADNDEAGISAAQKAAELTGAEITTPCTRGMDFNDWLNARAK